MVKIEQDPIILCDICKTEIPKRKHDLHISYGYWEEAGGFTAFHSDQDICDHCFTEMRKTIDTKLETLKPEDEQDIEHWSVDENLFKLFNEGKRKLTIKYVAEKIDELICNFRNNSDVKEEDSINLTKIRKLAKKIHLNNVVAKIDKGFFTHQAEKFNRDCIMVLKKEGIIENGDDEECTCKHPLSYVKNKNNTRICRNCGNPCNPDDPIHNNKGDDD